MVESYLDTHTPYLWNQAKRLAALPRASLVGDTRDWFQECVLWLYQNEPMYQSCLSAFATFVHGHLYRDLATAHTRRCAHTPVTVSLCDSVAGPPKQPSDFSALHILDARSRDIVYRHIHGETFPEIAKGISSQAVSEIYQKAIRKLRRHAMAGTQ